MRPSSLEAATTTTINLFIVCALQYFLDFIKQTKTMNILDDSFWANGPRLGALYNFPGQPVAQPATNPVKHTLYVAVKCLNCLIYKTASSRPNGSYTFSVTPQFRFGPDEFSLAGGINK